MSARRLLPVLATILLLATAGAASAHDHAVPGSQVSRPDRQFVEAAAIDGRFEAKMGRIAERVASDRQVKRYGAWMVQSHTFLNGTLGHLARRKHLSLPQQLDAQYRQLLDRLSGLRGPAFDRAYMTAMIEDHDRAIKTFDAEVRDGTDPDLREFAKHALARLARHDQVAQSMRLSLTAVGSTRPPGR